MKSLKNFRCSLNQVLLLASVLINIVLFIVVIVAEKQGHVFGMALERRNLISLSDQSHPDYWARMGWKNSLEKLDADFDVAFYGNSITRGSDFQQYFPNKKIINLGYAGDNMTGMLRRVPMLQATNPSKIFIMAGTNDLFHITVDEFEDRYNRLLDAINDSVPNAKVYVQSVLPMNQDLKSNAPSDEKIRQANKCLSKIAVRRHLTYINIYDSYVQEGKLPANITPDGVHLLPSYYDKWASSIEPYVNE